MAYDHYTCFNYVSTWTVFRRLNLTSTDVKCWRLKSIATLYKLNLPAILDAIIEFTKKAKRCQQDIMQILNLR